jgi:hypothetical protein
MRRAIETVPRDGKVVILEDDASGSFELAHWSTEARAWVRENGELSEIMPTYWHATRRDEYVLQEGDEFLLQKESGSSDPSTSRERGPLPFPLGRGAPQWPLVTGDGIPLRQVAKAAPVVIVGPHTAPDEAERGWPAWRRFAISSIAAAMVAASLMGMYFRSQVAAYVTLYAGQQDTLILSPDSQKTDSVARDSALPQQAEADRASSQAGWWDTAPVKQAVEGTAPEALQPVEKELGRAEATANELAEARRDMDGRNLQQGVLAKAAQTLQQEQEKTAALVQDVAAVREELRASAVQHRRDLAQQRDRGDTLASELARAHRDLETQVALSSKAGEEAAQVKQAAESATAELRRSLQKEHERAEALAAELTRAQRHVKTQVALSSKAGEDAAQVKQAAESATAELRQSLQKEHERAETLAAELAGAQRNLEAQVAMSNKAGEEAALVKQGAESAKAELQQSLQKERDRADALSSELARENARMTAQVKQAANSATAELQQSLQKEHDGAEALASELASAQRDIETRMAQSRKTDDGTSQLKQAAENAMAELRQSSQKEHDSAEALPRAPESTRRPIGARIAPERAANSQINQVKPAAEAAATEQPAGAEAQGGPEAARLLARASALLGQGNIGAARVVLERAAETGSAQAIFMLAETYDPLVLSTWRTYGTRGDATKARELYAKAHAGGIQEAKDRFDALR